MSSFKHLNSNQNSTIIDPSEAQDLLNVDITPGGKSVKKRPGYGLYKTIFTPSTGVHGGYHAFDASGNDVQIWASSVSVKGVVGDGTPNTIVSSMTVNSTLDCADSQGSIYCVNSNRDFYIRTNGTTLTNWYTSPLGYMIEATPDRMAVAGVSASPNTIFISQSNVFTNYTVGPLTTDAFTEVIAAPGSKITHIRWGCQKLLWWKDQSFGYFDFEDQYSAQVKIVSDNIGTFDNTSAIDPGGSVWFRGQDAHIYKYDCSGITKETIEITPQIQSSGRRTSNTWDQTSQSDWQAGSIVPTNGLSTSISAGDVIVSSWTRNEYTNTSQWSAGTQTNVIVGVSSLTLNTNNSGNIANNDFESASTWTGSGVGQPFRLSGNGGLSPCVIAPKSGSAQVSTAILGSLSGFSGDTLTLKILDATTLTTLGSTSFGRGSSDTTYRQYSVSAASSVGKRVKLRITQTSNGNEGNFTQDDSFILGGAITFWGAGCYNGSGVGITALDLIEAGSSTITTGSFTSQTFDTTFTSSTLQASQANWTASGAAPTFAILHSSATNTPFVTLATSTGTTSAVSNRYIKYVTTITLTGTDAASYSSYFSSVTFLARSSGTFYSAVKNAPTLVSWSIFNPDYADNSGSHTFYMRSSTSSFTVLSSTPAWTSQAVNGQVGVSTGTYFQVRDDFSITAATATPTLSGFGVSWFEGNATDQAYMLYFDNSIWTSVAYGAGVSSNTYILRRDLINDGWTLYNFGAGGMLVQDNHLYFGGVGNGNVYLYGSGTSDAGSAINAFWKSKDYTAQDPFLQSQLTQIDIFAAQNTGQSITSTYTMDTSTATSYSVSLNLPTQTYVQNRKVLPSGKNGYTFNLKLSDNSATSDWEVFGFRITYNTVPWRPN